MPGYRALSSTVTGHAADSAREAESRRREGDPANAVLLLEEALAASERVDAELPGWLCGRLAALYRTLCRYDDEVRLLERYRESQSSEEARSRYDARLSKARTIAERNRRSDSGALVSVRKVLGTPRRRVTPANGITTLLPPRDRGMEYLALLTDLFGEATGAHSGHRVQQVVGEYAADGRAHGVAIERLVAGLRTAAARASATHVNEVERDRRFSAALVGLLSAYFEER